MNIRKACSYNLLKVALGGSLLFAVAAACSGGDANTGDTDADATTTIPTGPGTVGPTPDGTLPSPNVEPTPGNPSPDNTDPGNPDPVNPNPEPNPDQPPPGPEDMPGNGGAAGNPNPDQPDPVNPEPDTPAGGNGGQGPGPAPTTDCTLDVTASISDEIATVGIVEFSTDLAPVDSARIEFGLDTSYGMTAPVDLDETNYRTLLLGMKPSSDYHFRVVVGSGGQECASDDQTVSTGAAPTNLPNIDISTTDEAAAARGFMVTGTYQTGPAYILDPDGDFVWWWDEGEVTRARMSYDGKYMWIAKGNVPEGQSKVVRVSMDGLEREDFSAQFQSQHHDFTVLPDERVVFTAYGPGNCDVVKERSPDGSVRDIIDVGEILSVDSCHTNAVQYSHEDDAIIVSDLDHDVYIKATMDGDVMWILGGGNSNDFTGEGATWSRQHGLDILGLDRLLIFNNGAMGSQEGSLAIEIGLDLNGMTATRDWVYAAQPSISNIVMGDVQRLENGNTLVTYSTQGVIHEVDPAGNVVREMTWGLGGAIGYVMFRTSLYGPPPK